MANRQIKFKSVQRAKKTQNGIYVASLLYLDSGNTVDLGTIVRRKDEGVFEAYDTQDELRGELNTMQQAGQHLRKIYDASLKETVAEPVAEEATETSERLLTVEDAAAELCPNAADPVKALRKRISRGSVETRETDNGTMVVVS